MLILSNEMSSTASARHKLVFYIPQGDLEAVKAAVSETGAGELPRGMHKQTRWETTGTDQFLPMQGAGAGPTIGELISDQSAFHLERAEEMRRQ